MPSFTKSASELRRRHPPLPQVVERPDGGWELRPSAAVERLTPAELAKRTGLCRNVVYIRINDGTIPQELVEYAGPRKILIHPKALELLKRRR